GRPPPSALRRKHSRRCTTKSPLQWARTRKPPTEQERIMLRASDNELLTRTDAGTGMGELFRRFWIPALLSQELPEPDCPPLRVRIMGESLLAFRDTAGRVGLIEPQCAHRGANLFWGRNEQGGIRCAFHGWKYDVNGACLEMPTVAQDAAYEKQRAA